MRNCFFCELDGKQEKATEFNSNAKRFICEPCRPRAQLFEPPFPNWDIRSSDLSILIQEFLDRGGKITQIEAGRRAIEPKDDEDFEWVFDQQVNPTYDFRGRVHDIHDSASDTGNYRIRPVFNPAD